MRRAVGAPTMTGTTDGFRVDEHGATGEGLDTEAFQAAIDACADAGGGTVHVPPGEYEIGSIALESDVTIHVEAGATVFAAREEDAYDDDVIGPDGERPFVRIEDVENVSFVGRGVVDGRGTEIMDMDAPIRQHSGESESHPLVSNAPHRARQGEAYLDRESDTDLWPVAKPAFRPGPMFLIRDATNVLFRDLTLRDMPAWTISIEGAEEVDVRGLDVLNHMLIPNCDGISIVDAHNVHVSDCTIESCDDSITLGATAEGGCGNVTVTNCALSSSACAIKFGSETDGPIRNCTFENCVVYDSNRGLGIQHRDSGLLENVLFSDFVVETGLLPGPWWGKGEPIYVTSVPRDEGTDLGTVRNVRFSNVVARSESGALVYGHGDADIRNVALDGVRIEIRDSPHAERVGGNFDLQPTGVTAPIYEHDVPALHVENAADVEVSDLTVEWADDVPSYHSSGLGCVGVEGLLVEDFVGRQAHPDGDGAAIDLREVRDVTVRDCRAAPGTGTFLATADTADERLLANNDALDAETPLDGEGAERFHATGNAPSL